jgi:hypothetical protein
MEKGNKDRTIAKGKIIWGSEREKERKREREKERKREREKERKREREKESVPREPTWRYYNEVIVKPNGLNGVNQWCP